ncbi:MAG TPA: CopG family transcriptional regulator [Solirubrobacterales bacterium]
MSRRTQIYLDADQTAELDKLAAAERTNRSTIIRRAIDAYLSQGDRDADARRRQWQEAVTESAGIAPYLPDGVEYVDELRKTGAQRLAELEW